MQMAFFKVNTTWCVLNSNVAPVAVFIRVVSEEFAYMKTFDDNTVTSIVFIITIALNYLFKMACLGPVPWPGFNRLRMLESKRPRPILRASLPL